MGRAVDTRPHEVRLAWACAEVDVRPSLVMRSARHVGTTGCAATRRRLAVWVGHVELRLNPPGGRSAYVHRPRGRTASTAAAVTWQQLGAADRSTNVILRGFTAPRVEEAQWVR